MSKILRCKKCGDIIQSTHRHDMVWCKCGAVAIDGGDDYCKVTGNLEDMEFLSAEKDLNDMFVRCMQMLATKDKEIAMLEKALELACKNSCFEDTCDYCEYKSYTETELGCPCYCESEQGFEIKQAINYFKTKAKEIVDGKES